MKKTPLRIGGEGLPEGRENMKKYVRSLALALLIPSLLGMAGCGDNLEEDPVYSGFYYYYTFELNSSALYKLLTPDKEIRKMLQDEWLADELERERKDWVEAGSPLPPSGKWTRAEIIELYRRAGQYELAEEAKNYPVEFLQERCLAAIPFASPDEMASHFANWNKDIEAKVEAQWQDFSGEWTGGDVVRLWLLTGYEELADWVVRHGTVTRYGDFLQEQCVKVVEFDNADDMAARFERWQQRNRRTKEDLIRRGEAVGFVNYGYNSVVVEKSEESGARVIRRPWTKEKIVDFYEMAGRPDLADQARTYPEAFLKKECLQAIAFESTEEIAALFSVWRAYERDWEKKQ